MGEYANVGWLLPAAIRKDQKVAIFAPSAPGLHRFSNRFRRGLDELERTLKREVFVPAYIEDTRLNKLAGTPIARAEGFNRLIADPTVGAIFTTYGGFNTNEILNFVDWGSAQSNPKCVVGYSDTTALLLALATKTQLTTYYGPAVLPQFGEVGGILNFTAQELRATLVDGSPRRIPMLSEWYDQVQDWEQRDEKREPIRDEGAFCAIPGEATGRLFGGNADTINYLVGTEFLKPPVEDTILFLEMADAAAKWQAFRRSLVHLRDAGYLSCVKGIMIGRSPQTGSLEEMTDIFLDILPQPSTPVILNAPFGHFDPMATLPIGAIARIRSYKDDCSVETLTRSIK